LPYLYVCRQVPYYTIFHDLCQNTTFVTPTHPSLCLSVCLPTCLLVYLSAQLGSIYLLISC
jgi:hypothetical protein